MRARLHWARRQGHPHYLWPGLEPAAWRAALAELERVATAALRGAPVSLEAASGGPRALGVAGYTSGLGPLVGHWIETGVVRATEPLAALFRLHLEHGHRRAARQRQELERSATALDAVGVRALVVKSAHTARYFPERGTRPGVDVDLVVAPAQLERAEEALRRAGYTLAARQHRPAKSDWLPPGVEPFPRSLELLHSGSQYAVDLQASLERNFFGVRTVRVGRVEEVPSRAAPELGPGLSVLAQPALLAYLALHASEGLHNLTLVRLVELVLVARRDAASGELVWPELARLLEDVGGTRFAYPALALAERLAPGTVDPAVLGPATRAATPRMRRIVEGTSPGRAQRLDMLPLAERFMWCATPLDYGRRLAHMAAPAPAGRSLRRLADTYAERAYRLLRGRVGTGREEVRG